MGKRRCAVSQSDIARVAAMLRHVALKKTEKDPHNFPGGAEKYVAGHLTRNSPSSVRFSYMPLPSVGHPHADGMIRRVLIVEPYGGNGEHVKWAERRLANGQLIESGAKAPFAILGKMDAEDYRMVSNYTRSSKAWLTVTPVILPGFDDGKYEKALGLLRKAIRQAGLDIEMIEDANLRKAPFLSGSLHPSAYFKPDYLRDFPGWHVYLQFREPLDGPLAIGLGRHIGLGLFVPAHSD
jgi:CRISPR-associated protein Csb2